MLLSAIQAKVLAAITRRWKILEYWAYFPPPRTLQNWASVYTLIKRSNNNGSFLFMVTAYDIRELHQGVASF